MKGKYWIIAVYLVLLVIAIPWYWPNDISLIVFGFPVWVFVAILVSLITSIFTAFILLRYSWSESTDLDE